MNVLIADDEAPARQRLCSLLATIGSPYTLIGQAENGVEVVQRCALTKPDLVLLDIRMPVMDGIDAARALAGLDKPPAVIFVTAFDEHALQAFEANAIDYLLKPIRQARLEQDQVGLGLSAALHDLHPILGLADERVRGADRSQ